MKYEENLVESYLIEYVKKNGFMPTQAEISKSTLLSTYKVYDVLMSLASKGIITKSKGKARGIKLNGYEFVKRGA